MPRSLGGRDFDLLFGELKVRDETIGLFSVALPTSFVTSAINQARTIMIVIFSVAAIAVLVMGIAIAHGVTRPLLALVRSSRAVAG